MDAQFGVQFPQHSKHFPDIHHRKCFLIHPSLLQKAGIPVYRHIQHPGMIAITVPKGYHAGHHILMLRLRPDHYPHLFLLGYCLTNYAIGFSHGFTLAESSNFALSDWLRIGSRAAERYRWRGAV